MASGFDLTKTARSLLTIEVNTIVRDAMTGEPMPPVPHALLDIASDYAEALSGLGVDLPRYFNAQADNPASVPLGWLNPPVSVRNALTITALTFDRLRWAARRASMAPDARLAGTPPANRVLLERIVNNADAIKEMFKRFDASMAPFLGRTRAELVATTIQPGSYAIATDDLIALQKMWDIGVEEIVAQTIVHVTGDVTTRVQEALRRPGSETLFAIHRQSIDVSVSCWKSLLDAVAVIAGTTIRALLGSKV